MVSSLAFGSVKPRRSISKFRRGTAASYCASWVYQCAKVINIIADATSTHHAIATPNSHASRVIEATPNQLGFDRETQSSTSRRRPINRASTVVH